MNRVAQEYFAVMHAIRLYVTTWQWLRIYRICLYDGGGSARTQGVGIRAESRRLAGDSLVVRGGYTMWRWEGAMARWGGHHLVLKKRAPARIVPLQRETEREGMGSTEKGNDASWVEFFVLEPCVGDKMTDSSEKHISPPHMVWIWRSPYCPDGWILGCM